MKTKIIIVGDKLLNANSLSTITNNQYEVIPIPAAYPPSHLEYLGAISLILLNLEKNNFSLIQAWRRHTALPIISLMAEQEVSYLQKAYRNGSSDVVITPIDYEELLNALQRLTEIKPKEYTTSKKRDPNNLGIMNPFLPKLIPDKLVPRKADSDISIHFFGTLNIYINGRYVLKGLSKQRQSLLAYLIFHARKKIHKDRLVELFWDTCSRNNLNVAIHAIRKKIAEVFPNEEVIQYEQGCYFINPVLKIDSDIDRLNSLWEKGKTMERRGNLESAAKAFYSAHCYYSGQFLENLYNEPWTGGERESFAEKYMVILSKLSQYFFQQKDWDMALQFARLMLKLDNCLEDAHRIIMKCASYQGEKKMAVQQYKECKNYLAENLGISPSINTEQLFHNICLDKQIVKNTQTTNRLSF